MIKKIKKESNNYIFSIQIENTTEKTIVVDPYDNEITWEISSFSDSESFLMIKKKGKNNSLLVDFIIKSNSNLILTEQRFFSKEDDFHIFKNIPNNIEIIFNLIDMKNENNKNKKREKNNNETKGNNIKITCMSIVLIILFSLIVAFILDGTIIKYFRSDTQ